MTPPTEQPTFARSGIHALLPSRPTLFSAFSRSASCLADGSGLGVLSLFLLYVFVPLHLLGAVSRAVVANTIHLSLSSIEVNTHKMSLNTNSTPPLPQSIRL